jgi:hypothetical protein
LVCIVIVSTRASDFADSALQVQHHQQPAKADVLSGGHSYLNDLGVGEIRAQPAKKVVIGRGVIESELFSEFDCSPLTPAKRRIGSIILEP